MSEPTMYRAKVVIAEVSEHGEEAPYHITKQEIWEMLCTVIDDTKDMRRENKQLKRRCQNLEQNLHLFAPGDQTVKDYQV